MEKIEIGGIYKLVYSIKGWPVENAKTIADATDSILGSPYWDIPKDCYRVLDKNEIYSLLAVSRDGKVSPDKRYLAVNITLKENIRLADANCGQSTEDNFDEELA